MLGEIFILFVFLGLARGQGLDLTTQEETSGTAVVSACLSRIKDSEIFSSDNELIRRIAYVETDDGNDDDTYRADYDGGIWALDENLFDRTKNTASYSSLTSYHQSIQTKFSIDWSSVVWNDLRKPLYSALAARLYLTTVSASIPISSSVSAQATYWVNYYNTAGSTTTFTTLVNQLLAQDECSVSGIDIYFVMDESGSVGYSNYQLMKQFVYNTVDEFDIGPDDTQVGVISYSSYATLRFYLNTYSSKSSVLSAINNLPYNSGGTNTASAITSLRQSGFTSSSGGRPTSQAIPRVGVVITDGYSNSYINTVNAATAAHNAGITLFAVGIGSNVNSNELSAIASDPSYVSTISGFDSTQFAALQRAIANEACTTSADVSINEVIDTSVGQDETTYIEVDYDQDEGVTIKVEVDDGEVIVYASDRTTTPNEAFYDWMIETDGSSEIFLDPDDVQRTIGDTVYIAIEGEGSNNEFTFVVEEGDTTTGPDPPVNITIASFTATTVTITWSEPAEDADLIIRYDIELIEYEFGLDTIENSTNLTYITITGLEEYNTYDCKIASVFDTKVGDFSSLVNFTTSEAAPTAAPRSPTGEALTSTTITLEWDPPPEIDINGEIEYYVVEVEEEYTGREWTFHAVGVFINIGSLQAYYLYKCRIAAYTVDLGPFTDYFEVYSGEIAPTAAPENITVTAYVQNSVTLMWDPPPFMMRNGRIRYYNIEVREVETGDILELESNFTNITINDLSPFYNYTCNISAVTVSEGPSSDSINFVPLEGPPSGSPVNVTGSANGSSSITVNWVAPDRDLWNGYIDGYRIRALETKTGLVYYWNVTGTSYTITSLHPYYTYTVSVAAVTVDVGPYSDGMNISTDEAAPSASPRNFSAVVGSAFSANFSWLPPEPEYHNGIITGYVINVTDDEGGDSFEVPATNTSLTLSSSLQPYRTYICAIAAETLVGHGPFSSEVNFTTLQDVPGAPTINVSRRDGEPNELLVAWEVPEYPNGIILNYTVYCNDSVSEDLIIVSETELSVIVMNLTPFTYYDCYVTANTSVGEGNASQIVSAQTDETEPADAPANFLSTVINGTAVELTWDRPSLSYGIIISYTITYNTTDGNISFVHDAEDGSMVVIDELEEHTRYLFSIFASTRIGDGPSTSLMTRTDITEPHSPPLSILYDVESSTEVTLSWQPPPFEDRNGPITYYTIILKELVFGLEDVYINVTALSYSLTNLEEYNNYSFVIAAATQKGLGPYSTATMFTTEEDSPSSAPLNVTADVRSSTFVAFTWLAPPTIDRNGVINYYVVKLKEIETDILWTFFAVDEDINIGSLHPYYRYDCTVAATTSVGTGPATLALRIRMNEAAPSGPPLSLTSVKTSTSFTLFWDPPADESQNGVIHQYRIRVTEEDTDILSTYITNTTSMTFISRHPYYVYKCSVAAETVGVGPYTSILTIQLDEDSPATAPLNFTVVSVLSTLVRLSWSPPLLEDRNGVIRSYTINSTELETDTTSSYTSAGTSLTINSLHPYYQYMFTISAVTVSTGPSSSAITVRTLEAAPSSPVQNTSDESVTSTSITLTWEPVPADKQNGIILFYTIRVVVQARATEYYNSTSLNVTLTQLNPYTTYQCSIAAENSAGRGPFSTAISVETDEDAPSSPPQNLTGYSSSSDSITLTWSSPLLSDRNGIIREYRLNITEVNTGSYITLTSTTTSRTVQSLHPYYVYNCTVSAYTVKQGPFSQVLSLTTLEDIPTSYPEDFTGTATSSRSVTLTWNPPNPEDVNGVVVQYIINVTVVETGEIFKLTSNTTTLTITTLSPFTTFRCIIAARTNAGIGPFSTVFTILTPEDVPTSEPTNADETVISSNTIYLYWDPPPQSERNGIIREYRINLTEADTGVLTTYSTSNEYIEISLLHPFYTYTWVVTAVTTGEGPYTVPRNITTDQDVPSGPPLNISSSEILPTSFKLTWSLPASSERNGIITGYNITVTSLDAMLEDPRKFFTSSLSLTVDLLTPYTNYVCIIAANTYVGIGPYSLEFTIRTEQSVPGAPPTNTTGDALNSTHVLLTWDPPPSDQINGVILGYRINITELNTGSISGFIANETEAVIGALHPHYDYNFTVVAFTEVGQGPVTYVVVRTDEAAPSSAPEDFQATVVDESSISLSWSALPQENQNGIIRHYEVILVALETGEIHIRTSVALSLTITSLRPYTTYNCTVAAETVDTGPYASGVIVRTLQTAPSGPPENVLVVAEDSRTLKLSWQPPDNRSRNGLIQRYYINITELESDYNVLFETTELSYTAEDLHPSYQYSCIIAAETVDIGPYSSPVFVELPEDAPSASPTDLTVTLVTSTSFYLSWTAPLPAFQNGLIRQYTINVTAVDSGNVYSYSTTAEEYSVELLHPYYYYTCSVAAVTVAMGPFSKSITIQTQIDVPSGPPQNIATLALSSRSLLLSWSQPLPEERNGPILSYLVRFSEVGNDETTKSNHNGTMLEINNLTPYTSYEWSVAALTSSGAGPFSSVVEEQTLQDAPDDAPQDVVAVNVDSTLIELSWSPPSADAHNGDIVYYLITYFEIQTGTNITTQSFDTDVIIGNLHPFYNYLVTIAAYTVGVGPSSDPVNIQTLEDAPSSPPVNIIGTAVNATQLEITWDPPSAEQQNGIIRSYRVLISTIETGFSEQLTATTSELTLYNLHPFYTYSFLISAVTVEQGPYSETFSIQMPQSAPSGPPREILVNVASSESVLVQWNPPLAEEQNGIITSYTIRVVNVLTGEITLYQRESHHSQYLVESLHPYHQYDVSVAVTTILQGPFSTPARVLTWEDIPSAAPKNLTVAAVNSRLVSTSWAPPPADGQNGVIMLYKVMVSVGETREFQTHSTTNTALTFVAHPYYTYTISVAAETVNGTGPFGTEVSLRTPEDVPTGAPQSFSVVAVSSSSIRITWNPPLEENQNGVIRLYYINVTEVVTGTIQQMVVPGDENLKIVNFLHPNYLYQCVIAAYTIDIGPSAYNETLTDSAVPTGVPQNVAVEPVNATFVNISWEPPPPDLQNGDIELYQISIVEIDTGSRYYLTSTQLMTMIGPLHPYYRYQFSVAAETVDVGPFSSEISLRMPQAAPSGMVRRVTVEVVSPRSVRISWIPAEVQFWNGDVIGYTVVYENNGPLQESRESSGSGSGVAPLQIQYISIPRVGQYLVNGRDPSTVSIPLKTETALVEDLEEYYSYSFLIYQETSEGMGPLSDSVSINTPEAVPDGTPTNIELEEQILRWQPPKVMYRNGIIIGYIITITFANNGPSQKYYVSSMVELSFKIEGIPKQSTVLIKIAAENSAGVGPFSDEISYNELGVPSPPQNVTVEKINDTAVSIMWITPQSSGGITEYQVIYTGYKDDTKVDAVDKEKIITVQVQPSRAYSLVVNNLVPGLYYEFQVSAMNNQGLSDSGTAIFISEPTTPKPIDNNHESGVSGGRIAAIILGILAAIGWIFAIAIAVYIVRHRYNKARTYKVSKSHGDREQNELYTNQGGGMELQDGSNGIAEPNTLDEKPPLPDSEDDVTTEM